MKKSSDKNLDSVTKTAQKFFQMLGIQSEVKVTFDDTDSSYTISIDSKDEAGLLIGNRGDTLSSLQSILGMIVRQLLGGEWHRVNLNVSDWKEKQESRLKKNG